MDDAVETAHNGIFSNAGQNCCAASKTYVQEGIYDEFVRKAAEMAQNRRVGSGFEKDVQQGPQIDQALFDRIMTYIEYGKVDGAKLEAGGERWGTEGYFIKPTVFSNVTEDMRIAQEEIFGPVQSILKFKTLDEVIQRANKSDFGLAGNEIYEDN